MKNPTLAGRNKLHPRPYGTWFSLADKEILKSILSAIIYGMLPLARKLSSAFAVWMLLLICLLSFSLMLYAARTDSAIDDEGTGIWLVVGLS